MNKIRKPVFYAAVVITISTSVHINSYVQAEEEEEDNDDNGWNGSCRDAGFENGRICSVHVISPFRPFILIEIQNHLLLQAVSEEIQPRTTKIQLWNVESDRFKCFDSNVLEKRDDRT